MVMFSQTIQTDNRIQFVPPKELVNWTKESTSVYYPQYKSMCELLIVLMSACNKDMIDQMEKELNTTAYANINTRFVLMIEELERNYNKKIEGIEEPKPEGESFSFNEKDKNLVGKW